MRCNIVSNYNAFMEGKINEILLFKKINHTKILLLKSTFKAFILFLIYDMDKK